MTIQQATDILMMSEQERWRKGYEDTDVEEARNIVVRAHSARYCLACLKLLADRAESEDI